MHDAICEKEVLPQQKSTLILPQKKTVSFGGGAVCGVMWLNLRS